jgi:hypothetical protein
MNEYSIASKLFGSIHTSHKSGPGLVGGLAASRELKAFVGSFTVALALLGGWAMAIGALGALGSGFCRGPGSGWVSKVLKYDIALCRGAECKAEVIGNELTNYGGQFAREVCRLWIRYMRSIDRCSYR